MKKFSFTSALGTHKKKFKDIKTAIQYKNDELCQFQQWVIREVIQVKVKCRYSKRKLVRSK